MASLFGAQGRFIAGRVLNHAEAGVTAIYDKHSYDAEKRQALDAWGRRLTEILEGKRRLADVVAMGARA